MDAFADLLSNRIQEVGNCVCIGIDPRWELMPSILLKGVDSSDPSQVARVVQEFCQGIIDVVGERVPIIKPQLAFFEQFGPAGMKVLSEVISYGQSKNCLVLLDGKRNDIGSTAKAYAQAYLGRGERSVWGGDALTVSSYLGEDSIQPFVDAATENGAGIFLLVKTSNPGSGQLQDKVVDDMPIYHHVAEWVNRANEGKHSQSGYGPVGAVTGATHPEQLVTIRSLCPNAYLLVPGYGAQGGTSSDVAGAFDENGLGAIINSSRGVINAYASPQYASQFDEHAWQGAIEASLNSMIDDLRANTPASALSG